MIEALRSGDRLVRRRPVRLAKSVVADLIDAVVSGRLSVGDALPGEQSLCGEFDVSRVVIREALKSLEQKGLVVIRQGLGTVVAPPSAWNPLDDDVLEARVRHDESLSVLENLVYVRVALECEMAAGAAAHVTAEHRHELDSLLTQMDAAVGEPERYPALDQAFHDLVMRMSGNDVARAIVSSMHDHVRASGRYSGSAPIREHLLHAQQGHAAIAAAVLTGDQDGARQVMRAHILQSWERLKALRLAEPVAHP